MTMEQRSPVDVGQGPRERPGLDVALAATSVGVFELRPETGRMRWTKEFASLHGLEAELLEGTLEDVEEKIHAGDRARVRQALEDGAAGGSAIELEYRLGGPEVRWLELRARLISEAGPPSLVAGTCVDVTGRK